LAVTKVTVNLPDDLVGALKRYASQHDITMTEALRRAISREVYFDDEISEGSKLLLERPDKSLREVVIR
jgi:predicted transcriptional regulator